MYTSGSVGVTTTSLTFSDALMRKRGVRLRSREPGRPAAPPAMSRFSSDCRVASDETTIFVMALYSRRSQ